MMRVPAAFNDVESHEPSAYTANVAASTVKITPPMLNTCRLLNANSTVRFIVSGESPRVPRTFARAVESPTMLANHCGTPVSAETRIDLGAMKML
jgi:hypothetical protein